MCCEFFLPRPHPFYGGQCFGWGSKPDHIWTCGATRSRGTVAAPGNFSLVPRSRAKSREKLGSCVANSCFLVTILGMGASVLVGEASPTTFGRVEQPARGAQLLPQAISLLSLGAEQSRERNLDHVLRIFPSPPPSVLWGPVFWLGKQARPHLDVWSNL